MYHATLNPKIVGQVIAAFRKKKGVSQEVLSGLADIGRTHLSAIERGERKPTLETLYRISTALNVSMSDIVKEIEGKSKTNFSHQQKQPRNHSEAVFIGNSISMIKLTSSALP